jgi:FkbM family methyltransferase
MLLDLINLKEKYNLKIKGILHIGAHFGQEYQTYKKLNIENVMFFEALGNFIGETEMFVEHNNQSQSSSILEPSIHTKQYPHIVFNDKTKVKVTKLDTFIGDKEKYNFINIDVQGYELEVFKGGKNYLNNIDYIMTEVNRAEVYKNCPMINEIDEFLNNYGFQRVETTWDGGTWGDAFYIKNEKN